MARCPLPAVNAGLYPVELREDGVGKIEPAVGEDVALDAAQDAKRGQHFVRGSDLLGLPVDIVGGKAADGADGRRVIADREVVIAAPPLFSVRVPGTVIPSWNVTLPVADGNVGDRIKREI